MRKDSSIPYVYRKRDVYYFSRRIPKDLLEQYRRPNIALSLKTKSSRIARAKSATLAAQLDEQWMNLRWRNNENPLIRFLTEQTCETRSNSSAPLLSEGKIIYLSAKASSRPRTFVQSVERAVNNLISVAGNKPIDTYTRKDANLLRDTLFKRGLSGTSVKRLLSTIRATLNFVTRELDLDEVSSFSSIFLGDDEKEIEKKRNPIPIDSIRSVQNECLRIDDEGRWLIALISDTGMRLSEAVGLHKQDITLNSAHPHVVLKAHPWRRLKTRGSERIVPLAGTALWAVRRAIDQSESEFLFPRYCDHHECKGNSASAALNKWLGPRVPNGRVIHSFRHSFRDRLRAVECPQDIADRLGGWSVVGVGESYGAGYPEDVLYKWVDRAISV